MKTKLNFLILALLSATLFTAGLAVGRQLPERKLVIAPVTAEMTFDARNRPTTLKQCVTMPDGQTLQHGSQFKWAWHDEPMGCIVPGLQIEREEYTAGVQTSFATWSDPSPTLRPNQPINPSILFEYPDER